MLSLKDRILLLKSSTKSEKAVKLCEDASRVCGNKMLESAISEQLLTNLSSEANDPAVRQFITREKKLNKVQNLGIKESYQALCNSELMQYPTVRPILERMSLAIQTIPEYAIVESYLQQLDGFSWNKDAKTHAVNIRKNVNESKEDIDLCNFMYEAKQQNNYLLPGFQSELDNYFINRNSESRNALMEKIKPYVFDQSIMKLNSLLESKSEGMFVKADGSVNIDKIYSPVISKNGATIFCNEGKFFAKTKTDLTMLSESQAAQLPRNFITLCRNLNSNNVKINESKIDVFTNTKTVSIIPDTKEIQVNGKNVDYNVFTRSFVNEGLIYGSNVNAELNQITNIFENAETICEIDFGKHLTSKSYKGHSADLYRFGNQISIYEMNSEFGTAQFFNKMTATQARQMLIEHLNYDIKDSFCDLSVKESEQVNKYKQEKEVFEKNLEHLMNKKNQVLEAVNADPYLKNSEDIEQILEAINIEISKLQNEILTRNNLIKNISSTSAVAMFEEEEFANQGDEVKNTAEVKFQDIIKDDNTQIYHKEETTTPKKEDSSIKSGDEVQLKNGKFGTVQGFENSGDNCIILMQDGSVVSVEKQYLNEIKVIKQKSSAINPEISKQSPNGAMSVQVMEGEEVCPKCGNNPCTCKPEENEISTVELFKKRLAKETDTDMSKVPSSSDPTPYGFEIKDTTEIPAEGNLDPKPEAIVDTVMPTVAQGKVKAQLVDDQGNIVMDEIYVDPKSFTSLGAEDKICYMTSLNSQDVFTTAKKYVKTLI